MTCYVDGCDHPADYMEGSSCACHLDLQYFQGMNKAGQDEAIRRSALENDKFEVDGDGNIRLKEE